MLSQRMVAYVTGAAQGLGRATAVHLAKKGAKVVAVDLGTSSSLLKGLVSELGESNCLGLAVDVTSPEQVKESMQACQTKFGVPINVAVNCAGILSPMRTLSKKGPANLDAFAKVLQVNVVGTFNVVRLAAEVMSQQAPDDDGQRGVIVNTASIAAMEGQIGQAAYASSKGAIASMTLPVARDLSSLGIRVMCIAPGLFMTPMLEGLPPDVQAALAEGVPFPRRLGRPSEYAKLVHAIIDNTMLNGEVIRLDGALRMQPN